MPENAVYVGRPTMWGNPYEADTNDEDGRKRAVMRFIAWLAVPAGEHLKQWQYIKDHLYELQGKDLACVQTTPPQEFVLGIPGEVSLARPRPSIPLTATTGRPPRRPGVRSARKYATKPAINWSVDIKILCVDIA